MNKAFTPIFLAVLGFGWLVGCGQKPKGNKDIYFTTVAESEKRVKDLGLDKASEDASYILDANKLTLPKEAETQTDTTVKEKPIAEFAQDAIIILEADKPMKGVLMWDVLQSLGLKWGDGDLFHWDNKSEFGEQQFFSVWTSTDPGYFFPETVKSGEMNPRDLIFGFSIPRSADPENVFEAMIAAAKYSQKRLGGKLLDKNLKPFNEAEEKKALQQLVSQMKSKGLIPGSSRVLKVY